MKIKELFCFKRDHFGKFIPKEVNVLDNSLKETDTQVFIIPLVRGEVLRYYANFDEDNEPWNGKENWIILNKIIRPKFSKDDINHMHKKKQLNLIRTVLHHSGVKFSTRKAIVLDNFAKNLQEIKEAKKEAKFAFFLHKHGYSLSSKVNNLNSLHSSEVDMLIQEFNKENKPKKGKKK